MVISRAAAGGHEFHAGRRIWLIRHGETTAGSSTRYYGATDVPLADLGREQVQSLAPYLHPQRFVALLHSPLSRAAESARIVAAALGRPPGAIGVVEEFREVDFGAIEGQTAAEIARARPEWFARWQRGAIDGFPEGEDLDEFAARVACGVDRALAQWPGGDLCFVAHRGVVKNALCHLCGLPRPAVRRWPLDLGSACVVVCGEDGRYLLDRYNLCAP